MFFFYFSESLQDRRRRFLERERRLRDDGTCERLLQAYRVEIQQQRRNPQAQPQQQQQQIRNAAATVARATLQEHGLLESNNNERSLLND